MFHSMILRILRVGEILLALLFVRATCDAGEITQYFPADRPAANMRTQWRVVWGIEKHAGGSEVLFIKEAYFRRGPAASEPEIKVLGDCRLAEIFVPYNGGTRIYDISGEDFSLVTLDSSALGPSCVLPGKIFNRAGQEVTSGLVIKEVHDGHIRWMNRAETIRRGQNMVIWSVLDGANYRYIMLYEFRDDGHVGFRLGATAHNLDSSEDDYATHLHMGCWRINVELGNPTQTAVSQIRLDTQQGKTLVEPIAKETRIKWVPEEFTGLRIESMHDNNKHNPPHPLSYELVPFRTGSGRFFGTGEQFTLHDLWVTRARAAELRPRDLDSIENGENLGGGSIVIWHHTPLLHVPRDEDFGVNGSSSNDGVAIATWAGFDLKPRDFFPSTPLYP